MALTLNGSTGISGIDGSAGTPAVIGSDADTGIFTAAGKVSASINGVEGNVPLVSGTAQASTSGTSIDFTGIPSWVKRVTVMFSGVSTNGTSNYLIQAGTSGGVVSTGYLGSSSDGPTLAAILLTSGIGIKTGSAATVVHGAVVFNNVTGNAWTASGSLARSDSAAFISTAGSITLSGTLDRIRITTGNGTDTFDAGSINIMYE